jgi:hypothetical protein
VKVEELKALPIQQNLQIMETLWQYLRDRFDQLEISEEQKRLLEARRSRALSGTARILEWNSVKTTIGTR